MTRFVRLGSLALLLVTIGCGRDPKLVSVTPTTICANEDSTITITGSDLSSSGKVQIGSADADMGSVPLVAAASVTGSGSMIMAKFPANSLTPHDSPLDLVYSDGGKRVVLTGVITVVPGISISAVDPATVYNGVDFPTSVYGTGMGAVKTIQISMAGGAGIDLTGVNAVDNNRADAVVPMGTPPGVYDVTVVDQNGCTATLAAALTVTADLTVSVCAIDPPFGYDMEDTDVVITATADGTAGGAACGGKTTKFASSPRAWLNVGGVLKPLSNVAFVSGGSVTATVPKGLTDGGPYDLIVQNPDGGVGLLAAAFKVVNMPVPQISSITPTLMGTNQTPTVHILGKNFRSPVKVEVYQPNATVTATGTIPAIPLTTVANPTLVSANEVDVVINLSTLGLPTNAGYTLIFRVTDTDQGTYGEFSALAVISSSLNPAQWTDLTAAPLPMATMRAGGAAGQSTSAAHHLYVIGGDAGGATPTPYATTQVATLDKYGNVGSWTVGHNKLAAGRTMLAAVAVPSTTGIGGFVYAIGGYDGTAPVATVSRAKILLPTEAPVVTKTAVNLGGTLARGAYYYRVSAVLDGTDPANPNGETLPSDEVTAHTVDASKVTLTWDAVPKAATYRVYRTAMINGVSQTEVLLKDGITDTTFTDDGTLTAGTDVPFKAGELGVWVDVSALKKARRFAAAALAHDSTGAAFLYAIGGDNDTGYGKTIGATATVYNTYEYAALTGDGLTLGTWTEDMTHMLTNGRTRLGAAVADKASAPAKITDTTAYVYAIGGGNPAVAGTLTSYEAAAVGTGGALGTWGSPNGTGSTFDMMGVSSMISSDNLFAIGGTDLAGAPAAQPAASSRDTNTTLPSFGQLNADSALAVDFPAGDTVATYAALVYSSAHLYLLGGAGADAVTGLKRVWSDVF